MNSSKAYPYVNVIIPTYNGEKIITGCLKSLMQINYPNYQITVVDDASTDESFDIIKKNFPSITVIQNKKNLGFAGACNAGIRHCLKTNSKYICILNNDAIVDQNWLTALVDTAERHQAAAVQSKIKSIYDKSQFDYSGAAGGLIDVFGYPFALGRLFMQIEKDRGQYDKENNIFFASGCSVLFRKSALKKVGLFDETLVMHMEEVDLCWRLLLQNQKILSSPKSIVFHHGSYTLKNNYLKKYLNHRNNLIIMLKNYSLMNLLWIYPIRLIFEFLTFFYCWKKNDFDRFKAIINSQIWILKNLGTIIKKRNTVQRLRQIPDRQILKKMYRGSILMQYFILNKKKASSFYRIK